MCINLFLTVFFPANKDFNDQGKDEEHFVAPILRKRKAPERNVVEEQFDAFVCDFDSKNPDVSIQFKRNWAKDEIKKSRRQQGLSILRTGSLPNSKNLSTPIHGSSSNDNSAPPASTRVPPRKGWDGNARHTVQHGFKLLGYPPQFVYGKDQWRGPDGIISRLMEYAALSGNRARQMVKQLLLDTVTKGDTYDAGNRTRMQRSRKQKLDQAEVDYGGKLLKHGTGSFWTVAHMNYDRIHRQGKEGISRSTFLRIIKDKFNSRCHRRQTKSTGSSKGKSSVWSQARLALAKQFKKQIRPVPPPSSFAQNLIAPIVCHLTTLDNSTSTDFGSEPTVSSPQPPESPPESQDLPQPTSPPLSSYPVRCSVSTR